MNVVPFEELACPLDGQPLLRGERSWTCPSGHSFDISRQGYTHLLPVQKMRSRDPGDSKAMVAARRDWLEAGFYRPISDALAACVLEQVSPQSSVSCLDAGCGEGYYLRRLAAAAQPRQGELALLGLDISKWAVSAAAKRDKRAAWVVASNAALPVRPACLDWVICAFGFPVHGEFARVLKPGGHVLMLEPGPEHLRELREIIYPSLKPARPQVKREEAERAGLAEHAAQNLRYLIELDRPECIADLLTMTPHLYRASAQGRARAAALSKLTLTVDVGLSVWARQR